jgi:hypothetical protein
MAPERGESPPPETQSGSQLKAPPGDASLGDSDHRDPSNDIKKVNKEWLESAESNPEHILHEHAGNKTSKELGNITLKSDGSIVK